MMGMCRTFQNGKLASDLTVLENVMSGAYWCTRFDFFGTFFHLPFKPSAQEKNIKDTAIKILKLIGMENYKDREAGDLSWFERQFIQIGRSMFGKPKLLLLDEPTAGMGRHESAEVNKLIRYINKETGTTIILVAHDVELVTKVSDVITCINFGKKICEGLPGQVQKNQDVLEAYLGTD
jgi:branched-chain amino acid transport system ATP-binding protein